MTTMLETVMQANPGKEQLIAQLQADYEMGAELLGYNLDRVLCCGVETAVGDECNQNDYNCGVLHQYDAFCVCSPCYRITFEVDEAFDVAGDYIKGAA